MEPIRVLFVDDEVRLCRAWARLIEAQPAFSLVGMAHCADGLPELVEELAPDVVLIDLSMPGRSPLSVVRELADRCPGARCVIYSGHNDPEVVRSAVDAGAWGYVDKLADSRAIFGALERVAHGTPVFPTVF